MKKLQRELTKLQAIKNPTLHQIGQIDKLHEQIDIMINKRKIR